MKSYAFKYGSGKVNIKLDETCVLAELHGHEVSLVVDDELVKAVVVALYHAKNMGKSGCTIVSEKEVVNYWKVAFYDRSIVECHFVVKNRRVNSQNSIT